MESKPKSSKSISRKSKSKHRISKFFQVHPEEMTSTNPTLINPYTKATFESIRIARSLDFYLASLNVLREVGRLYIEADSGTTTNDNLDDKIFHISNEAGERIFTVNVSSMKICAFFYWLPRRIIDQIEIKDNLGEQIINSEYVDPNPFDDCWKSFQDLVTNQVHFIAKFGIYILLGEFNYNVPPFHIIPCAWSANEFIVDCGLNQDKFIVEALGPCCFLKIWYYCRQRFHSFRIKQYPSPELVIGEMHINWPENPGIFGISFPQTMSIESKAMLLVLGIYLNEQHLEQKGCWGRVGNIGVYQRKVCTFWVVITILLIPLLCLYLWWDITYGGYFARLFSF